MMDSNNQNSDDNGLQAGGTFCSICLQSLLMQPEPPEMLLSPSLSPPCIIGACLPCGHCFHSECFNQWEVIYRSTNANKKPICPLCKITTAYFIDLKHSASSTTRESDSESNESVNSLRCSVKAQSSSHIIGAYVPCGHCFIHNEQLFGWDELITTSVRQYESHYDDGEASTSCSSCNIAVVGLLKLFIEKLNVSNGEIQDLATVPCPNEPCKRLVPVPTVGPSRITISDAGIAAVNGEYFYYGQQCKANKYTRAGVWNNVVGQFNVCVCPCSDGRSAWFISLGLQVGEYKDIDFYYLTNDELSYEVVPPLNGWFYVDESYVDDCGETLQCGLPKISYDCSTTVLPTPDTGGDKQEKDVAEAH